MARSIQEIPDALSSALRIAATVCSDAATEPPEFETGALLVVPISLPLQ